VGCLSKANPENLVSKDLEFHNSPQENNCVSYFESRNAMHWFKNTNTDGVNSQKYIFLCIPLSGCIFFIIGQNP